MKYRLIYGMNDSPDPVYNGVVEANSVKEVMVRFGIPDEGLDTLCIMPEEAWAETDDNFTDPEVEH